MPLCVVPKAAKDMMQLGRLQGFDGKITAQGKLLHQDTLLVSEISQGQSQPKFKERRVFLFEQIILFSEMSEKKRGDLSDTNYVYKNSMKVNNMALTKQVEGEPLRFMLINKTPGSDCKFVIQAPSDAIKHTWTGQITSLLDMQGDFLRALQSPIEYQNKVRKETSTPELSQRPREGLLRKTQSQSHPKKDRFLTPPGSLQDSKYTRYRSVPYPSKANVDHDDSSKLSCPKSPMETDKEFDQEKLSKLTMTSSCNSPSFMGEVSPKPKKNIFEGFKTSLKKAKSDASKSETNKVPDLLHDDEI
ncbi:rho guanine nucleotide exchange factor 25-like [Mytilus edulis]|uniref:rho guanine nucleotide exchange factor 25-like n=1 Tax=Mytilus edulis TaxID=6550 RepID=UPI0039EE020A